MVVPSQKDSPSLSKSIDKAELVRRAVAHAAAAAEYFPTDQDDDEESDDDDKPGEPAIARNLKVELGQASEHTTVNLEEAPDAKDKGVREALERRPIPVVEASAFPPHQVFGANTAAQLQSDAKARATAAYRATYGVGRYEADLKQRMDEAEIDQWYDDVDEECERKEEEKHIARRHQQLQVPPPPPPPRLSAKLPSGTVPPVEAAPMYRSSHADGLTEWTRTPSFEFAAKLSNPNEQAAFSTWAITGTCDPDFEHLIPRSPEADANPAPIIEPIETVAPVTQPQAVPPVPMQKELLVNTSVDDAPKTPALTDCVDPLVPIQKYKAY